MKGQDRELQVHSLPKQYSRSRHSLDTLGPQTSTNLTAEKIAGRPRQTRTSTDSYRIEERRGRQADHDKRERQACSWLIGRAPRRGTPPDRWQLSMKSHMIGDWTSLGSTSIIGLVCLRCLLALRAQKSPNSPLALLSEDCQREPNIRRAQGELPKRLTEQSAKRVPIVSEHVRPRQGTEICTFGMLSPLDIFKFLPSILPCSQCFLCNLARKSAQIVENIAWFQSERQA